LRKLICESAGIPDDFDASSNLYLDIGIPSTKAIQLLMDIEERFSVSVPDEEFVDAVSLDALAQLIGRLVRARDGQ